MRTSRLGCLSLSGIVTALATLLIIAGVGFARGGVMFNPGELNDERGTQPLGGVSSHAETAGRCKACHTAFWEQERMTDRCLVCHITLLTDGQNFHSIMLAQSRQSACMQCHTDHRGATAELTTLEMERFPHNDASSYSLQGHQQLASGADFACIDCHGALLQKFNPALCLECHLQIDAAFIQPHLTVFGDGCLECHDGIDTYGNDFDHNRFAFHLEGGHSELDCIDCHVDARTSADLAGLPQECEACHLADDPHQGMLGTVCAECHLPASWSQVSYDHDLSAFPLQGKHLEIDCEACHKDQLFKGTAQTCYACHAVDDIHTGQLGQECAACHTPQDWEQVTFDHSQSEFPLSGAHVELECASCHLDGVFKGTEKECIACHQADDPHAGSLGADCVACHTTEAWDKVTFDHALSAFPLTGAHTQAACEQCHVDQVYKNTPSACKSCHADPEYHRGLFGDNCEICHGTSAWLPAEYNESHRFPMGHGKAGRDCQTCHPASLLSYTCFGCHEHNQGSIVSNHREEGISDINNCVRCHPTGQEEDDDGGGD